MNNIETEFLNSYKKLDNLCKQILSSDTGISSYISEMEDERSGKYVIQGWDTDFRKLKELRHLRNQLVHDTSFSSGMISEADIEWLDDFYSRILNLKDPFAHLHNYQNHSTTSSGHAEYSHKDNTTPSYHYRIDHDRNNVRPLNYILITLAIIISIIILWVLSSYQPNNITYIPY